MELITSGGALTVEDQFRLIWFYTHRFPSFFLKRKNRRGCLSL